MNRSRVGLRKLLKFKTKSTTDLSAWNKNDEKLLKAVEGSDIRKVNSLLSKKTLVPNKLGPRGHSVFQIACASGNEQIVDALIKYVDDVNDTTIQGNTALQLAAAKGHTGIVTKLLQANADVDQKDSNDLTALHHACAGLHYQCVEALLIGNASPRATEKTGKTSLFYAVHRGNLDICKLLVERGADVNTQDIYQVTPLMIAAKEGHRDVCAYLLRTGAEPKCCDRDGRSAMMYAMVAGHNLTDVFENAPARASWDVPKYNEREIRYPDEVPTTTEQNKNDGKNVVKVDMVSRFQESPAPNKVEEQEEEQDEEEEKYDASDDMKRTASAPNLLSVSLDSTDGDVNRKLKELQEEHDQLNEEYHKLSIDNLKLRDKVESANRRLEKSQNEGKPNDELLQKDNQITNLKQLLQEEQEKTEELTQLLKDSQKTPPVVKKLGADGWPESDEETGGSVQNESQKSIAVLRSQVLTLTKENDQLKEKIQNVPNGFRASEGDQSLMDQIASGVSFKDLEELNETVDTLEKEKSELESKVLKLKEEAESMKLNNAITYEELENLKEQLQNSEKLKIETQSEEATKNNSLIQENAELKEELDQLRSSSSNESSMTKEDIETLQTLLEQYKISNQLLYDENSNLKQVINNNVLNKSESKSSEETAPGSVAEETKALTKMSSSEVTSAADVPNGPLIDSREDQSSTIELLEKQNEKLQDQVTLLSTELNKLRITFDSILKAGDDLQEDFDQLQVEKDKLQQEYERVVSEREEYSNENSYLLQDGNQMHEDLTKLVYELEHLQEKYKEVIEEKEDLERKVAAVSLAGKVGEVATLLEERDKLQQQCDVLKERSSTLQHDHDIVLEEVQSLQEENSNLKTQMGEENEEYDGLVQQNEILQQDYSQLEADYTDLLKEKDKLEQDLLLVQAPNITMESTSDKSGHEKVVEENKTLVYEKEQLELTIDELSKANALLEEEILVMKKIAPQIAIEKKLNKDSRNLSEEHEQEIKVLQSQLSILQESLDESEKTHREVVSMYRTHLISAVQGHMDPDVHQALHQIIEIRSMEQFC